MQLYDLGGEAMEGKNPLDAAIINGKRMTDLDNPGECTRREGMRERQADDLLLDRDRHVGGKRRLPTAMRKRALIQQTSGAITPKPLQLTPETLIREACRWLCWMRVRWPCRMGRRVS